MKYDFLRVVLFAVFINVGFFALAMNKGKERSIQRLLEEKQLPGFEDGKLAERMESRKKEFSLSQAILLDSVGTQQDLNACREALVDGNYHLQYKRLTDLNGLFDVLARNNKKITYLNCAHNYLDPKATLKEIAKLKTVERLSLRGNGITEIPDAIGLLGDRIKFLDLSDNNITNISPEIKKLTNLEVLDLSDNPELIVPQEIFRLSKLKVLFLARTNLQKLSKDIGLMNESLQELDLSNNPDCELPDEVYKLKNLKRFFLQGTYARISPKIDKLSSLEKISLPSSKKLTCEETIMRNALIVNLQVKNKGLTWNLGS